MIIAWIALLAVGVWLLIKSGVFVVRAISKISYVLGISEFVTSFVLMAFATTLPELAVGISAALSGDSTLALGNMIGANIVHVTLVLGLVTIFGKGITLDKKGNAFLSQSKWVDVILITLPVLLLLDGTLSRIDGGILLFAFVLHFVYLFLMRSSYRYKPQAYTNHIAGDDKVFGLKKIGEKKTRRQKELFELLKAFGIFIVAAGVLLGSSLLVVSMSENIALAYFIPELLIGIFIIGIGTSLPELSFGLRSVREGVPQSSIGNLLGAALLNATWVIGIVALINPIEVVHYDLFLLGALFMVAYVFLAVFFIKTRNGIDVVEGFLLVFLYVIFLVVQILSSLMRGQ